MTAVDSGRRLLLLALVFALLGSALVVRLGYWQVSQRDRLVASARQQIYVQTEAPSRRGDIFDRSGTVLLAGTVTRERLVASGQQLSPDQRTELVQLLTPILSLDPDAAAALQAKLDSARPYLVLATDLTPSTAETIRAATDAAGIGGISFETTYTRSYQPGGSPDVSLAAQLLGFVNGSGAGQYGVEQRYQDVLAGTPRIVEADKDASGQPIAETERTVSPGSPGEDLRLTLDASLQLALEQEVLATRIADRADTVSVVVMDPTSGEIYADASYPSYDANAYGATADANTSLFQDPVVSGVYEPGSVFKLLTTIAAFETGTATLQSRYSDPGFLVLDHGQNRIRDWDGRNMGTLNLADAIARSRNVVAAQVAFKLGPSLQQSAKILHDVWTRFGFGSPTGIDEAGEVAGLVNDPTISAWRQIDLANGSFGQGVAVTPIQLAVAYAAMVNGGILVQPHLVAAVGGQPVTLPAGRQVMDPSLTPILQGLMTHVLSIDTYRADVKGTGFWLGGKTGTAQIWSTKLRQYLLYQQNFSFVGFAGRTAGHPDLIIAVKIGGARPAIGTNGALILAIKPTELFRRVVTDAMTTPGLLPPLPAVTDPTTAQVAG
jgi:cell division protein FtsI/penicillin-binding protein 2